MTFGEFEELFGTEARTAEGVIKCLLVAAYEWFGNGNPDGARMFGLCVPKDQLEANGAPRKSMMQDQFCKPAGKGCAKAPIPASYLGGTPANHYTPDYATVIADDVTYKAVRINKDNERKLFVKSGGKDCASPVLCKCNNSGIWKVFEYSSLYTGVRPDIDKGDF